MAFEVVPIAETHIEGFHAALDSVARERRYLYFLEAPALEDASKFVRNTIGKLSALRRARGWQGDRLVRRPARRPTACS
jgi:hypothetical protein